MLHAIALTRLTTRLDNPPPVGHDTGPFYGGITAGFFWGIYIQPDMLNDESNGPLA